jgi:zinc transporter 1/2/3
MDADGNDVLIQAEGSENSNSEEDAHAHEESSSEGKQQNCHFHAGVE